jgi:peptidyl-prolyl cis-trans isomerase SurA
MNKTISAVVIAVVVVAAGWYFLSGHAENRSSTVADANGTVATVNGTPITRGQLTASESQIAAQQGMVATSTVVQSQLQSDALNSLIGQILLEQVAQQAGITASSTEVDVQLASAKAQFSTNSDYEKALVAQGMTENDLRMAITKNLVINAYLEQQLHLSTATATPAEIQAAYKQVSSQQTGTPIPPLDQVRDQVAKMVVQQKQQTSINAYVAQLRSTANIQILIATSTPAA